MISLEEATKRLKHRKDIKLCEETYIGWSFNAKFYDYIIKDYFVAIPRNVLKYNSGHPIRGKTKRENTILKKYGNKNLLKSEIIKNKIKETNIKKYGFSNPMQNNLIKNKATKTLLNKYNINNSAKLSSNRIIIETKEYLSDWYNKQKEPKPSYSFLIHEFENKSISIKDLERFFADYKSSKTFLEIKTEELLNTNFFNCKINNYKPDFKLSDNIFLNTDGLYWHSEIIKKDKWYHFNLRKEFEGSNLRIFQFREDEIRDKPEIVKSIVNNALGKTINKIYARKCIVKSINQNNAKEFLNENHLMGSTNAKHIGLYYKEYLICILSYKQIKNICKIERFCSVLNTNVVGGFSKLLSYLEKHCLKNNIIEIHNWVDLRYGTGKHLLNKDFKPTKETLGWKWTNYNKTYNRLICRANMNLKKLTQKQQAKEFGLVKIYDAGQRLYVKNIKRCL